MGRMIDLDKVEFLKVDGNIEFNHGVDCCINTLLKQPTVEAIPKADYENRLKADLKAILVELQLEIEELKIDLPFGFEPVSKTAAFYEGVSASSGLVLQKINSLKENENGNK